MNLTPWPRWQTPTMETCVSGGGGCHPPHTTRTHARPLLLPHPWAGGPRSGQNFRTNHNSPYIDYAVMHLWPVRARREGLPLGQGQSKSGSMEASSVLGMVGSRPQLALSLLLPGQLGRLRPELRERVDPGARAGSHLHRQGKVPVWAGGADVARAPRTRPPPPAHIHTPSPPPHTRQSTRPGPTAPLTTSCWCWRSLARTPPNPKLPPSETHGVCVWGGGGTHARVGSCRSLRPAL